jgi:hypothetical protein
MFNITFIREIKIKTIMRYHFTPIKMVIKTKTENNEVGKHTVKLQPSRIVDGNGGSTKS